MTSTGFLPDGYWNSPVVLISDIQQRTCEHYRIPRVAMVSQRRCAEEAKPRQVAMYLARELTPHSFPNIGRLFGDRDHTTVMHGVRQVEKRMAENPSFAKEVNDIKASLFPVEVTA